METSAQMALRQPTESLGSIKGGVWLDSALENAKIGTQRPAWSVFVRAPPFRLADGCDVGVVVARSNYIESTISTIGRPALRLGTHRSTNSRHQRSQPVGMQIRATSYRAWVLMVTGTVSR